MITVNIRPHCCQLECARLHSMRNGLSYLFDSAVYALG